MKLSKGTQQVYDLTTLDRNSCKIVGEFAGNDVHLQRGDNYYVLQQGQSTYVKTKLNNKFFGARLGTNRHLHVMIVQRRTPCSYVTEYSHTIITCHSSRGSVYTFRTEFPHLKGRMRRFFPNRTLDVQKHLSEYISLNFEAIPPEVGIEYRHGNFYLDLEMGMRKYLGIT